MSLPRIDPGRFNHIGLPSLDVEKTALFYCDVLGFRVVPRPSFSFDGRWLYRESVGMLIHLLHVADHVPSTAPIETRNSHFALQCSDYDEVVKVLEARGIEFVERTLPDHGYRQVFFSDPDGNVIELGEWPSAEEMVRQIE